MSTGNNLYINYNIERTTLNTTYDFDPAPASAGLSSEARRHVLGVEACLWGEMVPENHLDSQAFPRVLALAERGWGIDDYDFADFLERVRVHVNRLAGMGVVTGPAFGYPIAPTIPARVRNALPSLIYSAFHPEGHLAGGTAEVAGGRCPRKIDTLVKPSTRPEAIQ